MTSNVALHILCFFSCVILMSCQNISENTFSIERIMKEGINFVDVVEEAQAKNLNISSDCIAQFQVLLKKPEALLRMADAWSKFPYPGAFYVASRSDWGNYDECIKLDVKNEANFRVLGKFCTWGLILPDILSSDPAAKPWKLSTCIPNNCTAQDLINVIRLPLFNEMICSTKETDRELDTGAIITIVIIAVVVAAMIFSTAYDVYLYLTKKKEAHILFTAFSIYSNGKKLLAVTKQSKEQVLCFNGLKFISMWWIISGHGIIGWYAAPLQVEEARTLWEKKRVSQYITTAHICVDTFFYISGFLMSYLYFKGKSSEKSLWAQFKDVPSLILHRYLRLTPANGMCFLVSVYLFKYFNNGPLYSYGVHNGIVAPCKKYWWTFFLYIQNYYNYHYDESLCIPTTWYLSADMQLFLVAPLIIIPVTLLYRRSFKKCLCALFVLNIVFFAIPIFAKLTWRDYDPDFHEYDFHGKLISYFIGVMMGLYMRHEKQKTFLFSKSVNILLWFLALGTMHSVMWYRGEIQLHYGYVARSLCYSITRPLWCISLCWITYACVNGYGGIINWFLSTSFMQLGGKLTYSLYIVHGLVIANYALGVKYRFYFNDWTAFYYNCGHFVVSLFVATFWTLAFELPMITIEKVLFGLGKPRAPKPRVKVNGWDNPQQVLEEPPKVIINSNSVQNKTN